AELPGELTADELAEPLWACSSWASSSLTRLSRLRSLSMTLSAPGSPVCMVRVFDAPVLAWRSRRRAHLGGRSVDGKTHAILARRQFEQGDNLSHLTFRARHTTQLRNFGADAGVDDILEGAKRFASFSEPAAGLSAKTGSLATCDMLRSGQWK